MKRTPLARKSPLKRTGRVKPKRTKPRRSSRVRDPQYMEWIRTRACAAAYIDVDQCLQPIHAHHAGKRGVGQKASDDTCIPLCERHHREWHDGNGVFVGGQKAWRPWVEQEIAYQRRCYRLDTAFNKELVCPF